MSVPNPYKGKPMHELQRLQRTATADELPQIHAAIRRRSIKIKQNLPLRIRYE